jgi:hypothetical protein
MDDSPQKLGAKRGEAEGNYERWVEDYIGKSKERRRMWRPKQ